MPGLLGSFRSIEDVGGHLAWRRLRYRVHVLGTDEACIEGKPDGICFLSACKMNDESSSATICSFTCYFERLAH